jgi:hypothetical protein
MLRGMEGMPHAQANLLSVEGSLPCLETVPYQVLIKVYH